MDEKDNYNKLIERKKAEGLVDKQGRILCGAHCKSGRICRAPAMDNGRCRLHGGRNKDDARLSPDSSRGVPGRPPTHGKYSQYLKYTLKEQYEGFKSDEEFLSLQDEIAVVRTVLARVLSMIESDGGVDETLVKYVSELSDSVRKLTESYMKVATQKKYALSPEEVQRVMIAIVGIIMKYVTDEEQLSNIRKEIERIKV